MDGTVEIHGMEFFANHGCLPRERQKGNVFVVDVVCALNLQKAAVSDSLEDTLDCAALYRVVASQMEVPSDLLENVAWRIRKAILDEFPQIRSCKVSVSKKNPPLDGPAAYSRITLG